MMDAFFQTKMHPDDIPLTAVTTPFGLYEWTVMPMGLRNSPSVQQRRLTAALQPLIGVICHVYLDDIVIWSQDADEHIRNVRAVLNALRRASLYCNPKKTHLFCDEIEFLGHHISRRGIEANDKKVARILDWPVFVFAEAGGFYAGFDSINGENGGQEFSVLMLIRSL